MNDYFELEQRMRQIQSDIEKKTRNDWMLSRTGEFGWLYQLFIGAGVKEVRAMKKRVRSKEAGEPTY